MKKLRLLFIVLPVVAVLTFLTGFLLWAMITEYRPQTVELIEKNNVIQAVPCEFVVTIWNIGYAGMSAEMDFFMDGGQQTRIKIGRAHV